MTLVPLANSDLAPLAQRLLSEHPKHRFAYLSDAMRVRLERFGSIQRTAK